MNFAMKLAGPFLIIFICLSLVACGGDSEESGPNEVESNCHDFCTWNLSCLTDDEQTSLPAGYGADDEEGCISECIQANSPIYDGFRQCYDAIWEQNHCLIAIPCEDYGSDDNIVENRCGAEINKTEQVCDGGPGQ